MPLTATDNGNTRNVVVYGKMFTTAHVFIHALRRLLVRPGLGGYHFHCVFDDRRDAAYAASFLPADRVTVHAQYRELDPFRKDLTWAPETVKRWERLYGHPHLRLYMDKERILDGLPVEVKWRYLLSHIEYFENLIQVTKPVLYISGAASTIHPWVGMEVCRGNGVPCLSFYPTRFGTTSFLLDGPYEQLRIGTLYQALLAQGLDADEERAAQAVLDEYRQNAVKPIDYLYVNAKRMRALPRPGRAIHAIREYYGTDQQYYDEPLHVLLLRALKARRTCFYDWFLRSKMVRTIDPERRFFFFPLQFEPEMSLVTQGRGWTDQLELVRLISQSLPIDRWLYVKEHPNMPAGIRPLRFYRELTSLPRVQLLDRHINSYAIVPHAEAVLTITSTAGWEALMFNRPVGLFGHAFYEEFDAGVVQVTNPEELPRILLNFRRLTISDKTILAYIAAVLRQAKPGILIEPRFFPSAAELVLSDENLDHIGQAILDKLEAYG